MDIEINTQYNTIPYITKSMHVNNEKYTLNS